jgi:hypothetical protein
VLRHGLGGRELPSPRSSKPGGFAICLRLPPSKRPPTGDCCFCLEATVRVEIRAAPENARSRAIPERLGFTQEGTLRQVECVGDRYLDNVVYAMLAEDWKG